MNKDWHEQFKHWSSPPSQTEEEKGKRAATMVRASIHEAGLLEEYTISVYPTGSYRNNTNIRLGSDIDIAVVLTSLVTYDLPPGLTSEMLGFRSSALSYEGFRLALQQSLQKKFGNDFVDGNKTFKIKGNSYRLPLDVTPSIQYRQYTGKKNRDGSWAYHEGVQLRPKSAPHIINWHEDHYRKGVEKNKRTNRRYKRIARILKQLRDDMTASGTPSAKQSAESASSFLLECLAYNAPDRAYNQVAGSYYEDVKAVISSMWNKTKPGSQDAAQLTEVSERKLLFTPEQPWSQQEAHSFLLEAWKRVGF